VQLHVTPLFAESLETVAATLAVAFVCMDAGGAVVMATEIGGAVIVTLAVAFLVMSLTDVAVIVTLAPAGTAAGAVYVVAAPEAVWAGVNDPQAALGVQPHVTPLFAESLETVAATLAVVPVCMEAGGAVVIATEMAGGALMVTLVAAALVVSLTEVAFMVTLPPWGMAAGAVYVVMAPVAVWTGLKEPQDPLGAQLHATPWFAESLDTLAAIVAAWLVCMDAGGMVVSATEIGIGPTTLLLGELPQPAATRASNKTAKNLVFPCLVILISLRPAEA
jgi:hypothetical protein